MTTREPAADGAAPSPSPHAGRVDLPGGWQFEPLQWFNGDERDPEDMVYDLVTPEGDLLGQEWDAGDVRAFVAALARAVPVGGNTEVWPRSINSDTPHDRPILAYGPRPGRDNGHEWRETQWVDSVGTIAAEQGCSGWWNWSEPASGWCQSWKPTLWIELPPLAPAPIPSAPGEGRAVEIDYTNHAGIRSVRTVIPTGRLLPGDDVYHPGARWVIEAWDVAKGAMRTFDPAHVHRWGGQAARPAPAPPAGRAPAGVDLLLAKLRLYGAAQRAWQRYDTRGDEAGAVISDRHASRLEREIIAAITDRDRELDALRRRAVPDSIRTLLDYLGASADAPDPDLRELRRLAQPVHEHIASLKLTPEQADAEVARLLDMTDEEVMAAELPVDLGLARLARFHVERMASIDALRGGGACAGVPAELRALSERATPGTYHHVLPFKVIPAQRTIHGPALPRALPGIAVAYVVASVAVSLLWFRAAPMASIGVLALAESSWPLFAITVAWAMGEPTRLSTTGWIGAGLVMVGAPLIMIGGKNG